MILAFVVVEASSRCPLITAFANNTGFLGVFLVLAGVGVVDQAATAGEDGDVAEFAVVLSRFLWYNELLVIA